MDLLESTEAFEQARVARAMVAPLCAYGPAETTREKLKVDKVGLALLVLWIGALQIMLDIGREHDWFEDTTIVVLAIVAAVGAAVFVVWELTERQPIVP